MNKYEIGQKVWDTHNNCIYTLKSSKQAYGTTIWYVEENDFEWREDWFSGIPRYVQDLITKAEATEKELELADKTIIYLQKELEIYKQLHKRYQHLNENTNDYDLNFNEVDNIHNEIYELEEKLSKVDIEKLSLDLKMSDSMKVAGCHVLSRETYNDVHKSLTELERLQKKEIPMKPKVSIVYDNDGKHARANCSVCGAMVYQTCDLYPLKLALGGERPYCQHCGQHLSDDIDTNENHYCECV